MIEEVQEDEMIEVESVDKDGNPIKLFLIWQSVIPSATIKIYTLHLRDWIEKKVLQRFNSRFMLWGLSFFITIYWESSYLTSWFAF